MAETADLIKDLQALNEISHTLNKAVDVRTALGTALPHLVQLMGLETGWIFIYDPDATDRWAGRGFQLAAQYQLPPAIDLDQREVWDKSCNCQSYCKNGELNEAYNEVKCSRLAEAWGERNNLSIHASTPLQSNSGILGILNVAAPSWDSFDQRALELLSAVGDQMGVALERARLHDMLSEQYVEEQSALLTMSQKLLKRTTLQGLETFVVDEAKRLLDVDACALLVSDPQKDGQLYFQAAAGWRNDPEGSGKIITANIQSKIWQVFFDQKPLIANNGLEHPRSELDKWAKAEEFKSMAAVPLIVEGYSIGVLVVHTRIERHFTDSDLRFLQLLANQAAIAIEALRLIKEEIEWVRTERELSFGREIQQSMLPDIPPQIPGWQFATAYQAARQVGGDFYDFFQFVDNPDLWGIVIADVSDKGVPAALFMVLSRTTIRNTANVELPPSIVLQKTNRYILQDSQADMFLSVFYATLEITSGLFTYTNAGHNHPLWWKAEGQELASLSEHGILLGVVEEVFLDDYQIEIMPGDALIFYTDGITEAMNEIGQEFGEKRLIELLQETLITNPEIQGQKIVDTILKAVSDFSAGKQQYDDRTLLVIRR